MTRATLLLAAMTAAAFPTAASAATAPVGGGLIVIKPVRGFETRLAHAGTRLAALRPAGHPGGVYTLAVAGGRFAFTNGGGTVANRGSLRLRHGGRTVMITALSFTFGAATKVTAVVAGRRMTLFKMSRRQAHALGSTTGRLISGLRLTVTSGAAARVDALLGSNALGARGVAAIATVLLEAQGGSAGTSTASAPPGSSTVTGPDPGGAGGQSSSGATGLPEILSQLGIPGLPAVPGLPGILSQLGIPGLPAVPSPPGVPSLPLPGLPDPPLPALPTTPTLP